MGKITAGGVTADIEKKKIKHIYIRVFPPDGRVRITAPRSMSDAAVSRFLASHAAWIEKQRAKLAGRAWEGERQYVTGETHFLWGRPYRLEVLPSVSRNEVLMQDQSIVLRVRSDSTAVTRAAVMNEWYRQILKEAVPAMLEKCECIVGMKADECRVKNMRTKWGTCNVTERRIWLNLQLVKKAPEYLEYVLIHELTHLREKTHNSRFKAYMDRYCPDWRAIKKRLNGLASDAPNP
jgi:predicted metal-dependent hydrolase